MLHNHSKKNIFIGTTIYIIIKHNILYFSIQNENYFTLYLIYIFKNISKSDRHKFKKIYA